MRAARAARPATTLAIVLGLALSIAAAGCSVLGPTPSPDAACPGGDTRAAGKLPALEALLPRGMVERSPDSLDSGWICSTTGLGSYVAHDIRKLNFAGATWAQADSNGNGVVVAILALDSGPLDPAWVEEFYASGWIPASIEIATPARSRRTARRTRARARCSASRRSTTSRSRPSSSGPPRPT